MEKILRILIIFIILWITLIYPLIVYWAKKMQDPWQLRFVFGKMGVGKTGLIAKNALKDVLSGEFDYVYTSIGVPGTRKFDPDDIKSGYTFPPKSSVYIDEFGLVANSRDFKKFPKEMRAWFKFLRQSKVKCTIYSQAPDVDKAVRDLCHSYALLRRVGPFVLEFEVSKNIDVGQDDSGNGQLIDNYFKSGIIGGLHIHYLPRYFGLWNSFDPPAWEYIASEDIPITPQFLRSARFRKFYKFNFSNVYERSLRSVAAMRSKIYLSIFKHSFFESGRNFKNLQYFDY